MLLCLTKYGRFCTIDLMDKFRLWNTVDKKMILPAEELEILNEKRNKLPVFVTWKDVQILLTEQNKIVMELIKKNNLYTAVHLNETLDILRKWLKESEMTTRAEIPVPLSYYYIIV